MCAIPLLGYWNGFLPVRLFVGGMSVIAIPLIHTCPEKLKILLQFELPDRGIYTWHSLITLSLSRFTCKDYKEEIHSQTNAQGLAQILTPLKRPGDIIQNKDSILIPKSTAIYHSPICTSSGKKYRNFTLEELTELLFVHLNMCMHSDSTILLVWIMSSQYFIS